MEIIQTILYIIIIISCILLILLVLAQSNKGSDIGLFSGSSEMVFGSQKGNILTKTTAVLATILIVGTFFLGGLRVYMNKERNLLEKEAIQKEETKSIEDIGKEKQEEKKETTQQNTEKK